MKELSGEKYDYLPTLTSKLLHDRLFIVYASYCYSQLYILVHRTFSDYAVALNEKDWLHELLRGIHTVLMKSCSIGTILKVINCAPVILLRDATYISPRY